MHRRGFSGDMRGKQHAEQQLIRPSLLEALHDPRQALLVSTLPHCCTLAIVAKQAPAQAVAKNEEPKGVTAPSVE
uniref:Uncharacterized protein n=1 Tax=Peronospora matthiolae TaxID=2874970 RepID=A0AAV1V856_9STRA